MLGLLLSAGVPAWRSRAADIARTVGVFSGHAGAGSRFRRNSDRPESLDHGRFSESSAGRSGSFGDSGDASHSGELVAGQAAERASGRPDSAGSKDRRCQLPCPGDPRLRLQLEPGLSEEVPTRRCRGIPRLPAAQIQPRFKCADQGVRTRVRTIPNGGGAAAMGSIQSDRALG